MTETDFAADQQDVNPAPTFPWPPREGDSVIDALATTWTQSVFHPTEFFRRMPHEGSYGSIIAYYLIISVVAAGVGLFWSMLLPPNPMVPWRELQALGVERSNDVVSFLMTPIVSLIVLFAVTGVLHVMLMLVRGRRYGFETTARVVAFSVGPALAVVVPYVGNFIGSIWTIVLAVIGLREAHDTSTGKALAALLLPMFLIIILGVFLAILMVATGILI